MNYKRCGVGVSPPCYQDAVAQATVWVAIYDTFWCITIYHASLYIVRFGTSLYYHASLHIMRFRTSIYIMRLVHDYISCITIEHAIWCITKYHASLYYIMHHYIWCVLAHHYIYHASLYIYMMRFGMVGRKFNFASLLRELVFVAGVK